jgi:hypothetical protein
MMCYFKNTNTIMTEQISVMDIEQDDKTTWYNNTTKELEEKETINLENYVPIPENSVANFDYGEIQKIDEENLSQFDDIMLLKVLITRGGAKFNPILKLGSERLLRQLNCERLNPNRQHKPFQRFSNGGRGRGRGKSFFRGRGKYTDNEFKKDNNTQYTMSASN